MDWSQKLLMEYNEEDYLMLSGIQHFAFCRRQWALIHIEQQWADNYKTTDGKLFHKRAHDETLLEKRGDVITARGLRIFSKSLGVTGQCDVVEFHKDNDGITLQNFDGKWSVYPIEYKRGSKKDGIEDEVQLCAQAICLEEMLSTDISKGALFYGENRRRVEVIFSQTLKEQVNDIAKEMHKLFEKGYTPVVKKQKKCQSCSLKNICLPTLDNKIEVRKYINKMLSEE